MCYEYTGVTKFKNFKFITNRQWKDEDSQYLIVQKSSIPNAGLGLFTTKKLEYSPNKPLLIYYGEPLEPWYYNAIENHNHIFVGVDFEIKNVGLGVWRGIYKTLGTYINSTDSKEKANVELILDYSCVNHKYKFIRDDFVKIYVKKDIIIQPGEELFLYYGDKFWELFNHQDESHCCICLKYHSIEQDPMFLCDSCNNGFHKNCLLKLNHSLPSEDTWNCNNCSSNSFLN